MSLVVRDATPGDYDVFARLFPQLHVPDPLLSAAQFAEQMLPHTVIADDGAPVGYAHWRFYGATAHVVHVVVDARARHRGVGRALMHEIRRRAVARGASRWYLNVKADNAPAIALYERMGMSLEQRGWSMHTDWAALRALPRVTRSLAIELSDDAISRFASDHGLDPERLALVRRRPAVVFAALRDDGGTCAIAAFDPGFPSIHPIVVARPDYAPALFDALFPHARQPEVYVPVEGDVALATAIRRGGAKLRHEILRMAAPLP
ncbi:MAG: GNAT family N-acetyltransferase [Polyangiaceae bacterium]|nr:GNAT family N-acetyltransferase [Polyangiaceae bacterium]